MQSNNRGADGSITDAYESDILSLRAEQCWGENSAKSTPCPNQMFAPLTVKNTKRFFSSNFR